MSLLQENSFPLHSSLYINQRLCGEPLVQKHTDNVTFQCYILSIAAGQYASIYDNDAHLMVASGMII